MSRDFGATVMVDALAPAKQGLDVMRLLAEHATVDTSYGGQFVSGINGVRSTFGGVSRATAADWFYWVDGVMADVGADDWKLTRRRHRLVGLSPLDRRDGVAGDS